MALPCNTLSAACVAAGVRTFFFFSSIALSHCHIFMCKPRCDMFMATNTSCRTVCRFPVLCIACTARIFMANKFIFWLPCVCGKLHNDDKSPQFTHAADSCMATRHSHSPLEKFLSPPFQGTKHIVEAFQTRESIVVCMVAIGTVKWAGITIAGEIHFHLRRCSGCQVMKNAFSFSSAFLHLRRLQHRRVVADMPTVRRRR